MECFVACNDKIVWIFVRTGASVLLLGLAAAAALAQDSDNTEPVDEVIVYGSKLEATVQELPGSQTVLTQEFLENSRVNTISDIDNYVPNLKFSQLGEVGDRYISIRGISSNPLIENRVAVYIDDVPYRTINDHILVSVAQIEVLRGPQGALYGANTEAGVIVVTTKPVNDDSGIQASLDAGFFDSGMQTVYSLAAAGNLGQDWSARVAVSGVKGDPYSTNIDPDREEGDFDDKAFLLSLFYNPTERLELNLQFSGEFNRADGMYEEQYAPMDSAFYNAVFARPNPDFEAAFGISQINTGAVGRYDYHMDGIRQFDEDERVGALRVSYKLDYAELVSVTSFRDQEQRGSGAEFEFTSFPLVNTGGTDGREELYQELRLNSLPSSEWDWVVGLSYLDSERSFNVISKDKIAGATTFEPLPALLEESTDVSVFGHVRIPLSGDKLGLSLGARWERATRGVERNEPGIFTVGGVPAAVFPQLQAEDDFTEFLPRVALDYALNDEVRFYASVATGWQPGGFNDDAFVEGVPQSFTRYRTEKILTTEAGIKGSHPGRRLSWSVAAFNTEAEYWQEFNYVLDSSGVAQSTGLVVNAEQLVSKGFEAELSWSPTTSWQVIAGFGYTDAQYDEFEFTDTQGFTGNKLLLMPEFTGNLVVDYQARSNWFGRFEATHYGDMFLNPDNTARQTAYQLYGGSVGWRGDNLSVAVFVENLTDEYYFNGQAFADFTFAVPGLFFSSPGQSRTVGLQLDFDW